MEGEFKLRREWKTKNFLKGLEFMGKIGEIAEQEGAFPLSLCSELQSSRSLECFQVVTAPPSFADFVRLTLSCRCF